MNVFTQNFLDLLPKETRADAELVTAIEIADYLREAKEERDRNRNAVTRGQHGEEWIENLLKTNLTCCKVEKVASSKWSGDFVIKRMCGAREICLMLDVKNYTNPVPSHEIQKFHRDMIVRKYDAGMLLSLGTKFVGQPDQDSDMAFSTYGIAGRDTHVALVNSTHPTVITHVVRYLFSLVAARQHIITGEYVAAKLQELRDQLEKMSSMRFEIQKLNQMVTTGLTNLTTNLLDLDIRATALLDTIFQNIDRQPLEQILHVDTIETELGISIRSATMTVLQKINADLKVSADKKYITIGESCQITRLAKVDRLTAPDLETDYAPSGDYTVKSGRITFDLETESNLRLAEMLIQLAIARERQ